MRYMFDTNICRYILKSRPLSVKTRFDQVGASSLAISTVVLAEFYCGAARHPKGIAIQKEIGDFIFRLDVIPWDEKAAEHCGTVRAALEKSGTPIGAINMMIASHARNQRATLASNNTQHFEKVPGLITANWV
jgi:tRNA(fMet)-specific endonuclease VapC